MILCYLLVHISYFIYSCIFPNAQR
uniref:Uncharacterized protein n=1 Tax=Anguilla anguilla TaxID=7936 RepID=A0A0E9T5U3_ANGAN